MEQTEQEVRAEIVRNEQQTINETSRIIDALCVEIVSLPLAQVYLRGSQPDPISDTARLKPLSRAIDKLITEKTLPTINATMHTGTLNAWKQGERLGFASLIGKVPEKALKTLSEAGAFAHREKSAVAFIDRKVRGINLSERVWRLEAGLKVQIETVLQLAILDGRSAIETANDLKQYLKNPDALFRRVRDAKGKLQLSQASRQYRPGIGVYRSAYANAHRLARNEINNAYRRADWEQMQDLEFVTGYRIQLSNNHPVKDICDALKGFYSKSFQWTGWHVACLCHMTKEIISLDQFAKMERGEFTPEQTTKFPLMMGDWIAENRHRFKQPTGSESGIDWIDNNPKLLDYFTIVGKVPEQFRTAK